ncbi:hypothetical protein GGR57DRAFT_294461 [Xylariaceae sp. FL1272]|nr:hypothetical protein GGR57DRAFT_294461 [Xylariaceae sp. FL1272]
MPLMLPLYLAFQASSCDFCPWRSGQSRHDSHLPSHPCGLRHGPRVHLSYLLDHEVMTTVEVPISLACAASAVPIAIFEATLPSFPPSVTALPGLLEVNREFLMLRRCLSFLLRLSPYLCLQRSSRGVRVSRAARWFLK